MKTLEAIKEFGWTLEAQAKWARETDRSDPYKDSFVDGFAYAVKILTEDFNRAFEIEEGEAC